MGSIGPSIGTVVATLEARIARLNAADAAFVKEQSVKTADELQRARWALQEAAGSGAPELLRWVHEAAESLRWFAENAPDGVPRTNARALVAEVADVPEPA